MNREHAQRVVEHLEKTTIWKPTREELLEIALRDVSKPIPSTKGMDPKARALRLHAELYGRISLARQALEALDRVEG